MKNNIKYQFYLLLGGEITRRFIRNDYTFIKRLEKLVSKYEKMYYIATKDKD
jgi:hypothetical protein